MDPPEAKSCPMRGKPDPVQGPDPFPIEVRPPGASILLNPAAGAGNAATNPALALAMNRLGFDARPQQQPVQFQVPARPDKAAELALKRRDWVLDVTARQQLLSPRACAVERVSGLSGEDFLHLYYASGRPVIIAGAMEGWPALERWTPEHLAKTVGGAPVEYQGGRDGNPDYETDKDRHRRVMPFDRFIGEIVATGFGNDMYLTAHNGAANRQALAPLEEELGTLDEYLTPGPGMMWIGPAGTFEPLQFDLGNNLVAQVAGAKRVVMAPPAETQRLYNQRDTFSAVRDITDEAQLNLYPLARAARTYEVDLEAGDLLFVPIGWWHQVTALDFSVTLTYTNFRWPNRGRESFPAG
jgi:hypothetical protein